MNIRIKSLLNRGISRGSNMSVIRAIELARKLKPKLGEETTSELLDYIGNQNGDLATKQDIEKVENKIENVENKIENVENNLKKDINWLKWIVGVGFGTVLTLITYLHSDTGKRIDRIETDMTGLKTDMTELKTEMTDIKTSIERLETLIIGRR